MERPQVQGQPPPGGRGRGRERVGRGRGRGRGGGGLRVRGGRGAGRGGLGLRSGTGVGRGGVRVRGGGIVGRGVRRHHSVPDEIRATIIDHVVNHRLTMAEAGRRVQPNVPRSTVSSIIQTFRRENRIGRQHHIGGRRRLLTDRQEEEICNMVIANNAITLTQICDTILQNNTVFQNINSISISTIDRVLKKNLMTMKQIYKVPFDRNTERVKELRYQYVQRILAIEGNETPHILVFVDEAGFNLAKGRRRGRNVIGQRATVDVPGLRGGNITMCAAISENGVATHMASLGPYNTEKLLRFLDRLYLDLVPENERGLEGPHLPQFVVVWDNVSFHRGPRIRAWFDTHPRMHNVPLPPYSPFLNPIEEFFSAWRWRVYDHHAQNQRSLLNAMDAACDDITGDQCRAWIRHSRRFFPRCIDKEHIRCDVDENLWPNRLQRMDGQEDEEGDQEREGSDTE